MMCGECVVTSGLDVGLGGVCGCLCMCGCGEGSSVLVPFARSGAPAAAMAVGESPRCGERDRDMIEFAGEFPSMHPREWNGQCRE